MSLIIMDKDMEPKKLEKSVGNEYRPILLEEQENVQVYGVVAFVQAK